MSMISMELVRPSNSKPTRFGSAGSGTFASICAARVDVPSDAPSVSVKLTMGKVLEAVRFAACAVGMMASKTIIAINTDAEAPMVTKADYAVVGDLTQIVPAIVAEVKARHG